MNCQCGVLLCFKFYSIKLYIEFSYKQIVHMRQHFLLVDETVPQYLFVITFPMLLQFLVHMKRFKKLKEKKLKELNVLQGKFFPQNVK